jgi:aminoglycoside 2'-N-acetyltransferase I
VSDLRLFTTHQASPTELAEVRRFLHDVFDGDFSEDDWAHACGGTHVVVVEDGSVLAHASVVGRTLEVGASKLRTGYVEAVGTLPTRRHEGLGSKVMTEINRLIEQHFEMGALSTGSHAFYERLGWERWRGQTFVRDGDQLTHTADDDDSVMVLRVGHTAALDLTTTITCDHRTGDPW